MTQAAEMEDGEISPFAIGALLLRGRWRIARWALATGFLTALSVAWKPALYSASLSFVPQGNTDLARSGLASLAGQFGISTGVTNPSQSPDFYVSLVKSRELLGQIVRDTFSVAEMSGQRMSYFELFRVAPGADQTERAITGLTKMVSPSVVRSTGVVQVSLATKWPSVSLQMATAILDGVNDFNVRQRQSQAAAERKFIESRLAVAKTDLRAAEDRLQEFLNSNRGTSNSPQLSFERDRLQREVSFQQQVLTTLTQNFEDARIREVRDTPTITVFESPDVSALPEARGRLKRTALGVIVGGMVGAFLVLVAQMMARRREQGDPDADDFVAALREIQREVLALGRSRSNPAR